MHDSSEKSSGDTENSVRAQDAADSKSLPDGESQVTQPAPPEETPAGFAKVARRISGRTTDLLAIAVIGMGVIAVSGRLSDWWNTSPDSVIAQSEVVPQVVGAEIAWPEIDIPVAIDPGGFPVRVERLLIEGDLKKLERIVFQRLEAVLRADPSGVLPREGDTTATKAATKLETLLTTIEPVREQPDDWGIYRLDEPGAPGFSAMFIGTRYRQPAGASRPQIVTWAMAMPWRQAEWKVFFFRPADAVSTAILLPPGAELTMSMQEPSGTELAAFRARDKSTLKAWQQFYSRHFAENGWATVRPWSDRDLRTTARFENDSLAIELILKSEDDTLSGLASVIRLPVGKPATRDETPTATRD